MALTLYTGGAGCGKTRRLMDDLIRAADEAPGKRFFLVVPEQSTMQTQRDLVMRHPRKGILNLEVTSLNRMAYRVFEECGFHAASLIEEMGKSFLLEKIALEEKDNLPGFGATLARPENIAAMKSVISECMTYGVTPEQMEQAAGTVQDTAASAGGTEQAAGDGGGQDSGAPGGEMKKAAGPHGLTGRTALKIRDIAHVSRCFETRLHSLGFMTMEEVPEALARLVPESRYLAGSVIALDGFTGFTPVQLPLILALMRAAEELMVTVTIDSAVRHRAMRESDLFKMSSDMIRDLNNIAEETHTLRRADVICDEPGGDSMPGPDPRKADLEESLSKRALSGGYPKAPALDFLSSHFGRPGRHVYKGEMPPEAVRILMAPGPREEAEEAARIIRRLVREEGYRFRDIGVVTGDLGGTAVRLKEAFSENDIPYFIDEKRSLLQNPFVEYVRAALEACTENYSYDGMFRLLKCGMAPFDRTAVDHLDLYAGGTGLKGKKRWRTVFIRTYRGGDPGEVPLLNSLREEICALLDPLSDALASRGGTVRTKCEALYRFFVASGSERKLLAMAEELQENGRGDLAREYRQVYPYVCSLLDKMVSVLGNEHIAQADFRALLEAGFAEGRVAVIPPGSDRVLVGDVERSRPGKVKALLFLGVNEGLIPKRQDGGGFFTDRDRERLLEQGIRLKATAREAVYVSRFYLYLALSRPSERLYIIWRASDEKGGSMHPSYLVDTVGGMFPGIFMEKMDGEPVEERPGAALTALSRGLQMIGERPLTEDFRALFAWYAGRPEYREVTDCLLDAAGLRAVPERLSRETAEALYGRIMRNSATRLELFFRCEYAHFLSYGLKVKERPEYLFTGLDLGNIMHRSLELFVARCPAEAWDGTDDGGEDFRSLADACVLDAVKEAGGDSVLHASSRNEYQVRRMTRLMETSVRAIRREISAGDLRPSGVEQAFRSGEDLEEMKIPLPDGAMMILTGRIDRVDTFEEGRRTLVKIVDYKTGSTEFDASEVYYGLQLQLLIYLAAAMGIIRKEGKEPVPAGIFYYRISDPVVGYKPGETEEELEARVLKELKGSGIVTDDPDALARMDRELPATGKSEILPVSYNKKDQALSKASKAISEEAFRMLVRHAAEKAGEAGTRILRGGAAASPFRLGTKTGCDYCAFRSACRFDRRLPGCIFRELKKLTTAEVLALIAET